MIQYFFGTCLDGIICIQRFSKASAKLKKIMLINRRPGGYANLKTDEVLHNDLNHISSITDKLVDYEACYFCAGISSVGMNEEKYSRVTYNLTMNFGKALSQTNPQMIFCYVSGAGTDSTGKGRQIWTRVKGKTENDLAKLLPCFLKMKRAIKKDA
jgi:hypothetical protein